MLVSEHRKIMEAIFKGDKETAEQIMRAHIYNQEIIVIKNLKKQEEEELKKGKK